MTETTFGTTIDWTEYWRGAGDEERTGAAPAEQYTLDPLRSFVGTKEAPGAVADVGCGPGAVPVAMARDYPDATVVGYDAAEPVVERNRGRAKREGLSNLSFEHAVLPEFDPAGAFDIVTCFHTLVYVEAVGDALASLYDAVAPGGALVLTYHNWLAHRHFRRTAADPHEHLGENSPWDPDRFAERFELLIEGENLLSHERSHDILGT